jgi:hypothetical protein
MLVLTLKRRCDVDRLYSVHARHSRVAALWNVDDVRDHGHRLWITRAGLDDERDETGQGGDERVGELYRGESVFRRRRWCCVGKSGLTICMARPPAQIIYATLLEYAVDGKVPGIRQVVGCGLIVGASLYGRR